MRVLCTWTRLHPVTERSLAQHAPGAELVHCPELGTAWRAILGRWDGSDDLMTVEHDIAITADVIPAFEACPQPWCLFPYLLEHGSTCNTGLGCTRFRKEVQLAVSREAIRVVPGYCNDCEGARDCWRHMDGRIGDALRAAGYAPHVHAPTVRHCKPMTCDCPQCRERAA